MVATLGIYNSVARHPFVNYDDDRYVTDNPQVRAGLTWDTVKWAFTTDAEANWHPLTWISHALDCQLFRLNPAGHHYVNLLIHAANVVLLFLLLWRATGHVGRSAMVAALFALHPINVESVAWVAERKNVLSMLFFLLGLDAYRRYAEKPGTARYGIVALFFACGLMAKPMVITLPFVLLLWDYWPLRRMALGTGSPGQPFARLMLEKTPLILLSLVSAVITMKAQSVGGALRSVVDYPLSVRIENALVSYGRYVWLAVWPVNLGPMYPHPGDRLAMWRFVAATALLCTVTALVVILRRVRAPLVGWLWFLGTLVPMIGLIQVGRQALADRYAYLPFVGLFIMAVWGAGTLVERCKIPMHWPAIAGGIVLAALAFATHRQLNYWSDNVTLWSHTIAITHDNSVAQDNLGGALIEEGKIDEAMPHFEAAAKIDPSDPIADLNLASYQIGQGNPQSAIAKLERVVKSITDPRVEASAYSNLGVAYARLHDDERARENYQAAVERDPGRPQPWIGLGLLSQKHGDMARAIEAYSRAVNIQPSDVGYLLLAQALQKNGHAAEGQVAYENAARFSQNLDAARARVSDLLSR